MVFMSGVVVVLEGIWGNMCFSRWLTSSQSRNGGECKTAKKSSKYSCSSKLLAVTLNCCILPREERALLTFLFWFSEKKEKMEFYGRNGNFLLLLCFAGGKNFPFILQLNMREWELYGEMLIMRMVIVACLMLLLLWIIILQDFPFLCFRYIMMKSYCDVSVMLLFFFGEKETKKWYWADVLRKI